MDIFQLCLQGSRGRPKKQGNNNQGGGGEGSRGGGGEGYQEDRGEEPDNNNDPNFQPPSPSRKRPHSGDREEGGGGGGDDEGGVRHIAVQVPVNILEITAGLAVMEKMSVRQHLMFLSGVLRACGVDQRGRHLCYLCPEQAVFGFCDDRIGNEEKRAMADVLMSYIHQWQPGEILVDVVS